jgi:DNA-directed RNA polymerase subunit L
MERNGVLEFTLNVDRSVANALRRTIIADIPVLVFDTKTCVISVNTSRFTNEIVKQRIGCIPIQTLDPVARRFALTVAKKNDTDHTVVLTTADFVIRNEAGEVVEGLLPPLEIQLDGPMKAYYIDVLRLKPGEEFNMKCGITTGTGGESGQYNSSSLCSYGCTQDSVLAQEAWEKKPEEEKTLENKKNWSLLEAKRFVKPDSFEFALKTCSAYTNQQLVAKACEIVCGKLAEAMIVYEERASATSMPDCTDVVLKDGDYTIGKLLEYQIFQMKEELGVTYVTFFKRHPHDVDGTLRICVKREGGVKEVVQAAINPLSDLFTGIAAKIGGQKSALAPVLKMFKDLPVEEKRARLVSLGVDSAIVAKEPEEELDLMTERYLHRAERAQEVSLSTPEKPKKRAPKAKAEEDEPVKAKKGSKKAVNEDEPVKAKKGSKKAVKEDEDEPVNAKKGSKKTQEESIEDEELTETEPKKKSN